MKIPSVFLGSSDAVRRNFRRLVTRLRRGASLPDFFEECNVVDTADAPGSMISMSPGYGGIGGTHFRIGQLSRVLMNDPRRTNETLNRTRDRSLEYLSSSTWGVLVLNTPQAYFWASNLPFNPHTPSRAGFAAILRGTADHWDSVLALGTRFCIGSSAYVFPEILPLASFVLANCGIDPRGDQRFPGIVGIGPLITSSKIVSRLLAEDALWQDICDRKLVLVRPPSAAAVLAARTPSTVAKREHRPFSAEDAVLEFRAADLLVERGKASEILVAADPFEPADDFRRNGVTVAYRFGFTLRPIDTVWLLHVPDSALREQYADLERAVDRGLALLREYRSRATV